MSSIILESLQLGTLEVPKDQLLTFPQGIPGFSHARKFCLVQVKPGSHFQLLQSTEDPMLAFVVTDPLLIDPDYPFDDVRKEAESIGLEPDEPLAVAVIVTVPAPPEKMTANLMAPLVMGAKSRLGIQVILHDKPYEVRHEL